MSGTCAGCGAAMGRGVMACPACGTLVGAGGSSQAAPVAPPRPAPSRGYGANPRVPGTGPNPALILLLIGAVVAIFFVVGGVTTNLFSGLFSNRSAEAEVAAVASEDPDAPRPPEWFASYQDKFLSEGVTQMVRAAAQKRDYPTARGSQVRGKLAPGDQVSGRWVEGADPTTKWLKTDDGGYIWEGNLGSGEAITPQGILAIKAGDSLNSLRGKVNPKGHYGAQMADWDGLTCEIFTASNGLFDVMVENGLATSISTSNPALATSRGIRVGSSEAELRRAYGSSLTAPQDNPYDGADYFFWESASRGMKFHVGNGKVEAISVGSESINYVEGCL